MMISRLEISVYLNNEVLEKFCKFYVVHSVRQVEWRARRTKTLVWFVFWIFPKIGNKMLLFKKGKI